MNNSKSFKYLSNFHSFNGHLIKDWAFDLGFLHELFPKVDAAQFLGRFQTALWENGFYGTRQWLFLYSSNCELQLGVNICHGWRPMSRPEDTFSIVVNDSTNERRRVQTKCHQKKRHKRGSQSKQRSVYFPGSTDTTAQRSKWIELSVHCKPYFSLISFHSDNVSIPIEMVAGRLVLKSAKFLLFSCLVFTLQITALVLAWRAETIFANGPRPGGGHVDGFDCTWHSALTRMLKTRTGISFLVFLLALFFLEMFFFLCPVRFWWKPRDPCRYWRGSRKRFREWAASRGHVDGPNCTWHEFATPLSRRTIPKINPPFGRCWNYRVSRPISSLVNRFTTSRNSPSPYLFSIPYFFYQLTKDRKSKRTHLLFLTMQRVRRKFGNGVGLDMFQTSAIQNIPWSAMHRVTQFHSRHFHIERRRIYILKVLKNKDGFFFVSENPLQSDQA